MGRLSKINRGTVTKEQRDIIMKDMAQFLETKISEKGNEAFVSRHEVDGVLDEEVREFKEVVRAGTDARIVEELFDVACAALFGAASIRFNHTEW